MLRRVFNFFQWIFVAAWAGFCAALAMLAILLTLNRKMGLRVGKYFASPFLLWVLGIKVRVHGGEQVDWDRPNVFVMNHQSIVDIPVAYCALKSPISFVAKKSILYIPILGFAMWLAGMIFVDRSRSKEAIRSMKKGAFQIRSGIDILSYPEGTRSTEEAIRPFKRGAFHLAIEAKVPVVPVFAKNGGKLVPGGLPIQGGLIEVQIGKPIPTEGLSGADSASLAAAARDQMIALQESI